MLLMGAFQNIAFAATLSFSHFQHWQDKVRTVVKSFSHLSFQNVLNACPHRNISAVTRFVKVTEEQAKDLVSEVNSALTFQCLTSLLGAIDEKHITQEIH